jgi:hypothetical protein
MIAIFFNLQLDLVVVTPASCLPCTDARKYLCSRTGELLNTGLPSFRPKDLRRNAARLLAVDRRAQVPVFMDGWVARHRFALVQTQGLRRSDAARRAARRGQTHAQVYSRTAELLILTLHVKTETHRGELFVPPLTRGRSPRRRRWGAGHRAVADKG